MSQQNDFINVISHVDVTLEIIRKTSKFHSCGYQLAAENANQMETEESVTTGTCTVVKQ